MFIYKISNKINSKVYIGLTTNSVKERWRQHCQASKFNHRPLYCAMREFGLENFYIEQIDKANSLMELGNLERYYIKKYNSQINGYNLTAGGESNSYDANPRAKLSLEEVIQIREIYAMGEMYCKQCWEIYKDKISFSAFQKIWEGTTWKGIMDEVYTEETIQLHKTLHFKHFSGENNSFSKFTDTEVLELRKYYVTHTLQETYEKFSYKTKSKNGLRSTLERSYKHLPIYHKVKKCWTLNDEIIDINNYNPVSTILESEK